MAARYLVDTNLLVYAVDRREPAKRDRARDVLRRVGAPCTRARLAGRRKGLVDPTQPGDQAEALAATRRILARLKLEILGDEDALPGVFTGADRELLEGDTAEQRREDLRVFAAWHATLGTDPDAALDEMRERTYEWVMGRLGGA